MEIQRIDDSTGEPPDHFPGHARIQRLLSSFPSGPAVFAVHCDARGRSKPHTNAAGQVLHITSGRGMVGDLSDRHVVEAGDVVSVMPGEWHWHGRAPDSAMTHLTVQMTGPDSIDWNVDEGTGPAAMDLSTVSPLSVSTGVGRRGASKSVYSLIR